MSIVIKIQEEGSSLQQNKALRIHVRKLEDSELGDLNRLNSAIMVFPPSGPHLA